MAIIKPKTKIVITVTKENFDSQDVVFAATSKNESFMKDIWICDSRGPVQF
jgi:hypothetical protein